MNLSMKHLLISATYFVPCPNLCYDFRSIVMLMLKGCSIKSHIVCSESRKDYPAGIVAVIIISIEQQCPKTGSLQAIIPKWSLGSNSFVDISPGLSKTGIFT